jgi:HD-like signal output (HDOD) protein
MPVAPELRSLEIDIPAKPESLVKLSLLMAEDDMDQLAVRRADRADMALAAAVLKAVNSSLYGLKGRVQSVQQAITYLGMREVAASPSRWACARPSRRRPSWSRSGSAPRSAA